MISSLSKTFLAPALRRYRVRKTWMTPRKVTWRLKDIPIDRPVFFLGVQGGGLSIMMKCFQRLQTTCFCNGNSKSWDAADNEMHVCITDMEMPTELSFYLNSYYPTHLPTNFYRYWTYATDEAFSHFRLSAQNITHEIKTNFCAVIRKIIRAHAPDPIHCRFIDKSQFFTINIPTIQSILAEHNPYFILIGRSALGSVPRTARNYYLNPRKHGFKLDYMEALRLCAEHWNNSFKTALEDGPCSRNFLQVYIEDFFADPSAFIQKICDFTGLDYDPDMLPAPDQARTIYEQMPGRWYPLRTSRTDEALSNLTSEELKVIQDICGETMERLGYKM